MALPSAIAAKLGRSIRMLSSDNDGDVLAAVAAILRLLASCGTDIHALAAHVAGGLSEEEKQKIARAVEDARREGYAEGVRAAQNTQHGAGAFRNTSGRLEFDEVAMYVARERHRLSARHRDKYCNEFLDKMEMYAIEGFEPNKKQGRFLFDLFLELGGKIT